METDTKEHASIGIALIVIGCSQIAYCGLSVATLILSFGFELLSVMFHVLLQVNAQEPADYEATAAAKAAVLSATVLTSGGIFAITSITGGILYLRNRRSGIYAVLVAVLLAVRLAFAHASVGFELHAACLFAAIIYVALALAGGAHLARSWETLRGPTAEQG